VRSPAYAAGPARPLRASLFASKPAVCRCSIEAPGANRKRPLVPRDCGVGREPALGLGCLHRAHRPSSSRSWSRSKPAFSSSRMSMPVFLADSSRRPCAGTVIAVPGPRKRRWLVARRGSSSKSWVSNQRISVRFVSATGPQHAKAVRRARRAAGDAGCHRAGAGRGRRARGLHAYGDGRRQVARSWSRAVRSAC